MKLTTDDIARAKIEANVTVLKLNPLNKEIKIVKNVSFQVKRGKTLAVVGESGCGKSVTMNSIMRFTGKNAIVKADSIQYNALHDGKVTEYHLESITKPNGPEMRALRGPDLSMVFQDPMSSLNPVYKVGDQVAEGLLQHNKGMKKAEAREKVLEMFRKLGIPDPEERIDCYPHQFSGGMKQRVVIAIAMICNPELIICDEPTTALDVTIQAQIMELLQKLQETAPSPQAEIPDQDEVLRRIQSAYDLFSDPNVDFEIKGNALRKIVKKIIYDRQNGEFKVIYYV
mgnify:CR=1 FL=1